jgi:hypothetical protein
MDQLLSLLGYLPDLGTAGDWLVKGLAISGGASAALKFGTPVLKTLAEKTKTDKDDRVLYWANKVGSVLNFIAMNPTLKALAEKSKSRKKTRK